MCPMSLSLNCEFLVVTAVRVCSYYIINTTPLVGNQMENNMGNGYCIYVEVWGVRGWGSCFEVQGCVGIFVWVH